MRLKWVIRSVVSILAGYALFAVSAFLIFKIFHQPPHRVAPIEFMALATGVGMLGAFSGGYLSGALAGRRPMAHGMGVAVVLLLGATASLMATLGKGAIWSQVAAITLMAPSAFLGGWIRHRQGTSA